MAEITLYNTRTRRKERLAPVVPGRASMYVCGPTVYDRAHVGNARPVVVFDVLYRLLRHTFGAENVTYVRNITDVDDKIIARARASGRPIDEITAETTRWFQEDMGALGVLPLPEGNEPRATAYIAEMVAMIALLIERGHAYAAEGHVLFAVASYPDYGRLARRSPDDMRAGARVEVAPYKRNPLDFVLWKPSDPQTPGWDSPWGRGRPGWHIECSAMARALLGGEFDIHGGGVDLAFPHHENELAQSVCAHPGEGFARVWMHNGMLNIGGEKMSKSLGNFFTVRDLLDRGVPGEVIRFVLLSTHYRQPMDWTQGKVDEATQKLRKWAGAAVTGAGVPDEEFVEYLCDDLNTKEALDRLDDLFSADTREALSASANILGFDLEKISKSWGKPFRYETGGQILVEGVDYQPSVGVLGWGPVKDDVRDSARSLVLKWLSLRRERSFNEADHLRASAAAAGVELRAYRSSNGVNGGQAMLNNPIDLNALRSLTQ